jgi:transcriptional regulator with XRE-family HTH domain
MRADDGAINQSSFGTRIQDLRRKKGLTQRQVAAKLGIDFTYLSKIENDRGEPPGEETVRRLAKLYGVDPEELLAVAGKIPTELRDMAIQNRDFAQLLRRLPKLSTKDLDSVYKSAGVRRERQ